MGSRGIAAGIKYTIACSRVNLPNKPDTSPSPITETPEQTDLVDEAAAAKEQAARDEVAAALARSDNFRIVPGSDEFFDI